MKNKNNESMNKYIAGLFDGDGTITYRCSKTGEDRYTIGLKFEIITEHKNKHILYDIYDYFKVGHIYEDKYVTYVINDYNHILSVFNRISKHLIIKGTHGKFLLDYVGNIKTKPILDRNIDSIELKSFRDKVKLSRKNTTALKNKNFVTLGWLAGFIDADGNILYKFRDSYCKKAQKQYRRTDFALRIELAKYDVQALELIQKTIRGNLNITNRDTAMFTLALGKRSNSNTRKLMKHLVSLLKVKHKKYNLEQILHFINRRD